MARKISAMNKKSYFSVVFNIMANSTDKRTLA